MTYLRGKERSATDSVESVLEECVDELYPGAQEVHRVAKAALAAEREREAAGEGESSEAPAAAPEAALGRKDDFEDELRRELEELRVEREAKTGTGAGSKGKAKSRRPPSLISTFGLPARDQLSGGTDLLSLPPQSEGAQTSTAVSSVEANRFETKRADVQGRN